MPPADNIVKMLATSNHPLVDSVVAAALPTAPSQPANRLAGILLGRQRPAGHSALVHFYHLLDPALRERLLQAAANGKLDRALRHALCGNPARKPQPSPAPKLLERCRPTAASRLDPTSAAANSDQAASNALYLTHAAGLSRLAEDLVTLMRRSEGALRPRAAAPMVDWAERVETEDWRAAKALHGEPSTSEPSARDYVRPTDARWIDDLARAVVQAVVWHPQHRTDEVLEAWLALGLRGTLRFGKRLADPGHSAIEIVSARLSDPSTARERRALLPAIAERIEPLEQPAVAGLARCEKDDRLSDVLLDGHLIALPRVRLALHRQRYAMPTGASPDGQTEPRSDVDNARHLPSLFSALPLGVMDRLTRLADLADHPNATARVAAVREIANLASRHRQWGREHVDDLAEALGRFSEDASPVVARLVMTLRLRLQPNTRSATLAAAARSQHASVRRLAAGRLAAVGFRRLWLSWDRLSRDQRQSAGKALLRIDDCLHARLDRKLKSTSESDRFRSLAMIAELKQGQHFEDRLMLLLAQRQVKTTASVIRAMGSSRSDTARACVERALQHADPRVRANAISAVRLGDLHDLASQAAAAVKPDEAPRVRAEAIAAMLDFDIGEPLTTLRLMLKDARPNHRRSAVWLAGDLAITPVAQEIAEIALADVDVAVRNGAKRSARQLIHAAVKSTSAIKDEMKTASQADLSLEPLTV